MIRTLRKIWAFSGSKKGVLAKALIASILNAVFESLQFGAIMIALQTILGNQIVSHPVFVISGIMLISISGKAVTGFFSNQGMTEAGYYMCAEKRTHIADLMKYVPMGYFNKTSMGNITAVLTSVMGDIENTAPRSLILMFGGFIQAVIVSAALLFFDVRIGLVTVKSMMTQFQKEMWNRFTIPLVRLDSSKIQKIRANLPSNYNPFFYYDKTIISIDTLKRDVEYRTHLENAYWDIIVIDEAQNVAERGDHQAQRSRLAKLLADRSDTMIMLSATPHDGRAKSFASLMNMLDPTAIADPENYTKEDIKGLCIRRFKKDVKDQVSGSFLERNITLEICHASIREEQAYDIFAEMQLEMDLAKSNGTGQLFKTSLEKSLFSSPAACLKSIDARLKKLYKKYSADHIKDISLLEELRDSFCYCGR